MMTMVKDSHHAQGSGAIYIALFDSRLKGGMTVSYTGLGKKGMAVEKAVHRRNSPFFISSSG